MSGGKGTGSGDVRGRDIDVRSTAENQGAVIGQNTGFVLVGMDYTQTRALCHDLIQDELIKCRGDALAEAQRREAALESRFMEKLAKAGLDDAAAQRAYAEPAMQLDGRVAQKAYIRAGTPELLEMLTELLARRVKADDRTLLQITLSEAIGMVERLLPGQMAVLGLCFVMGHVRSRAVKDKETFVSFCKEMLVPLAEKASDRLADFRHLTFTGCGQRKSMPMTLAAVLSGTYREVWGNERMEDSQVEAQVLEWMPEMRGVFDHWERSRLGSFELTTVGIVIGALYVQLVTKQRFDLSKWT